MVTQPHPTHWQTATPFLVNLGLILATAAVTYWLRDRVVNVYTDEYATRSVTPPRVARPRELSYLTLWAVELGTVFGTAAVTAGSLAGLRELGAHPQFYVYAGAVLTLVGFVCCAWKLSPIDYDKRSFWGISYIIWAIALVNGALVAYAFFVYKP